MGKYQLQMMISQYLDYFDYANAISFRNLTKDDKGVFTNIVHIKAKTNDEEINELINEVNRYFDFLVGLKERVSDKMLKETDPEQDFFELTDEYVRENGIGDLTINYIDGDK